MRPNHLLVATATLMLATMPARADFSSCLAGLRHAAAAAGVSSATIANATSRLEPNDAVSFMGRQPEFTTPIWDYIAGLVDEERVQEGRAMLRRHASALQAAEARFGVDAATVVAVWGVESNFGESFGKRPVVQSLATLACQAPRRNDYFKGEFIAALKILQSGDIRPEEFLGSISTATAAAILRAPRPTRSGARPIISERAVGVRECVGGSRCDCLKDIQAHPAGGIASRCPHGRGGD
jgi:membrane-bound lytic murein transglycosylase B